MQPLVWTIAGFDPSNGAGISADCHTLSALQCHSQAIMTAVTAQNANEVSHCKALSCELIEAQFMALKKMGWPSVIKIGLLPNAQNVRCVSELLKDYTGTVIYDPVMISSSGFELMKSDAIDALKESLLQRIDVLTPNIVEAQLLTGHNIDTSAQMIQAGKMLLDLGPSQVIVKGGHRVGPLVQDLWINSNTRYWLSSERLKVHKTHGTGCVFSASLAAFIAHGYAVDDAFVLAKMTISQSIQQGYVFNDVVFPKVIQWPSSSRFLPWMTYHADDMQHPPFPACEKRIGFYPIVDCAMWVKRAIDWHVSSIQLRLKNKSDAFYQAEIQKAVQYAQNQKNIQLFINDHWQLAIENNAYGVHLGQEDLDRCDIGALQAAYIRLGVSTHSYAELARAHAIQPSYIALGPIYPTNSKSMRFAPQGIINLQRWRKLVSTQLVAIGGINLNNLHEILACDVEGGAVISAFTNAQNPQMVSQQFLTGFNRIIEDV